MSLAAYELQFLVTKPYLIGKYYYDSKEKLDQKIIFSEFKEDSDARGVDLYLNISNINTRNSEIKFEICHVFNSDNYDFNKIASANNCSFESKISYQTFPAKWITPFGVIYVNSVNNGIAVVDFDPSPDGQRIK